jgi:hypothetical protein
MDPGRPESVEASTSYSHRLYCTSAQRAEEGLEPPPKSSKKTGNSASGGAKSGAVGSASADNRSLARLIDAWPKLTDAARKAIFGIVGIDRKDDGR